MHKLVILVLDGGLRVGYSFPLLRLVLLVDESTIVPPPYTVGLLCKYRHVGETLVAMAADTKPERAVLGRCALAWLGRENLRAEIDSSADLVEHALQTFFPLSVEPQLFL